MCIHITTRITNNLLLQKPENQTAFACTSKWCIKFCTFGQQLSYLFGKFNRREETKITSNSIFWARHCDCDYVNGKCSHRHMNRIIFGKPIHKQVNEMIVISVWSKAKWLNIMSKASYKLYYKRYEFRWCVCMFPCAAHRINYLGPLSLPSPSPPTQLNQYIQTATYFSSLSPLLLKIDVVPINPWTSAICPQRR